MKTTRGHTGLFTYTSKLIKLWDRKTTRGHMGLFT